MGHVPPWCRRRPPTPVYALDEEASFGYCVLKKVIKNFHRRLLQKMFMEGFQRSTKIALGTGGALSPVRPLCNNVRPLGVVPLDDFLDTPLA